MPEIPLDAMPKENDLTVSPSERQIQEAVCIDTARVYDSCADKDCIANLRVYFNTASQETINGAASIRCRGCEVVNVFSEIEKVPYIPVLMHSRRLLPACVRSQKNRSCSVPREALRCFHPNTKPALPIRRRLPSQRIRVQRYRWQRRYVWTPDFADAAIALIISRIRKTVSPNR